MPSEPVAILGKLERSLWSKLETRTLFDVNSVLVWTHILDRVLESGVLSVDSVTKVALHQHDLLANFNCLKIQKR
jgi:hypothetical protein